MKTDENVDAYINAFPPEVKNHLKKLREMVKKLAPDAEEAMAYGMPGYKTYKKPLVYFAAFTHHIGLYATPSGHAEFKAELAQYKQGKGSVQFQLNEPIPFELISKIIQFRVEENRMKYGKGS